MVRRLLLVLSFVSLIGGYASASCTAPQNAIEAENCLPGNDSSQWSVSGSGDPTIQGFATDMSVNAGQTINFKISTPASAYTIGIFRIGYYSGQGARKVATVTPSAKLPQTQPACLSDSATRLYDCGTWAVSASWTVPSNAVSGVYLAVLIRSDTGGASQIIFIVRNDSSASDVVFQTADETWQAYNPYGGHSLYGPSSSFDLTNRAYKVSYNRPINTLNLESESWFMYAEYPMVRWLEANGYNVTYVSSVDAARNGALLQNHKLYLSIGHDEYVSGPKRASVEAARDAGVNLIFFSGNEFFWKTRWENSTDGTNTPFRTLVCYKETLGPTSNPAATAAVDPQDPPTWTGTWRDPQKSPPADGGRPENALTGQLFRVNGPGTDNSNLSIKVPSAMGKLRFWRNTPNVSKQAVGATWTLPASTLGYEWDVEEDNGSRPAGLFDLSSATYSLTTDYLQDAGGLYGAGTATHKMSMYRAPSGALVFGAGTVQWTWGLDSSSGGSSDTNMQQATVNLFADMGVQPATLQGGLLLATKSTDTTPPASTITSPTNGSSFQAGTTITITGTATDGGGGLVAGVEVSVDGGATWHPATGIQSWSYTWVSTAGSVTLLSRAVDDSANLEIPSGGVNVSIIGVQSVTLAPSTITGGGTSVGTVVLSAPAGSGGVTVAMTNGNSSVLTIPSSVLIPAGSTSATFNAVTNPVNVTTQVTITAKYASTATATLTVVPSFPPPAGSLAIDAIVSGHQGFPSQTITSPGFSTTVGNELLLALISSDALNQNMTVTGVSGAGLTWTFVVRSNVEGGTAEIWRAVAPSALANVSASATFSQSSPAAEITIVSFAGADTSGTNGSSAIGNVQSAAAGSGAPTGSVVTTRNNSWVLGVGTDYDRAVARTVGANQTLIDQYLTPTGDTLWMQRQNSPTPASGTTVTINDTAPTNDKYNLAIAEVRPVVAGLLTISGSVSATGSGATVALSGTSTQTATADASGNYSFGSLTSGSYTITPTKSGFAFTPPNQSVTLTNQSIANVNFTAAPTFSVGGTISPVSAGAGATVGLSGNMTATTTADGSGKYSFAGLTNGTYTVTPSNLGFAFTPTSQTFTVNGANLTGVNFTGQATTLVITTASLPGGVTNQVYSASLSASGGTTPYSWSMANNSVLPAGLTLSAAGQISGTPTVAGTVSFTVQVSDSSSPKIIATKPFSITIAPPPPPFFTIWSASAAPVSADAGQDNPVELGVRFTSDLNGFIKGIRFYKSAANTGAHVGNLWAGTGALIATVNFTGETASGWQEADFASPVAISAGTSYVASYHSTIGHYADDVGYFASSFDTPPLHALQDNAGAPDGVFAYGASSAFPSQGFQASNYWVDVAFVSSSLSSIAVTPVNPSIAAGATQQFTATGTYSDGSTQNITSQVTWSSSNTSASTINSAGLASGVGGGTSTIKAAQGSISGSTTLTVIPAPLAVTTTTLPGAIQNQAYSASLTATGGTGSYSWILINGTTLPAGLALSAAGQITGTPTGSGTSNFTVQVSDSAAPPQTATQALSIAVTPNACPCSISGVLSGPGGPGATVNLTGTASKTTVADPSGNYSFASLANGSYTVTPSLSGFSFSPASQPVTISGANVGPINFGSAAIPPTLSVNPTSVSFSATVGGTNPNPATVSVTNTGGGTLSFTATSDSAWLTVSPGSGSAPQSLQLTASITGLAAGTYTGHVTVTASGAQGSPATVTVTLTVAPVSTAIVIDATAFKDQATAASSVTSAAFSTKSVNELLLAFVSTDASSAGITVTGVTTTGLTWTFVGRTNTQLGTAEVWRAFAPSVLASVTVKATLSQSVTSSLTVMSFSGVDTSGTNGSGAVGNFVSASGATGAPSGQLTTSRNNSLVLGVGNDWDRAVGRTIGSGQVLVHQYLSPNGDTYWVQRVTAQVPLSGTVVTINDSQPTTDQWNLSLVEVRTP